MQSKRPPLHIVQEFLESHVREKLGFALRRRKIDQILSNINRLCTAPFPGDLRRDTYQFLKSG